MKKIVFCLVLAVFFLIAGTIEAQPLKVSWNPAQGGYQLDGYRIYYSPNLKKVLDRKTLSIDVPAIKTSACLDINERYKKTFIGIVAYNRNGESDITLGCLLRGVTLKDSHYYLWVVIDGTTLMTSGLQTHNKENIDCSSVLKLEDDPLKEINFDLVKISHFKDFVAFLENVLF